MCIVFFTTNYGPFRLIVASNRDEFFHRKTVKCHWWTEKDQPNILGGQDSEAGGMWFGVTKQGKFSFLTNVRSIDVYQNAIKQISQAIPLILPFILLFSMKDYRHLFLHFIGLFMLVLVIFVGYTWMKIRAENKKLSRGLLVRGFLESSMNTSNYTKAIFSNRDRFHKFNLVVGDTKQGSAMYISNSKCDAPEMIEPERIFGMSNGPLNSDWDKVERGKQMMKQILEKHIESQGSLNHDIQFVMESISQDLFTQLLLDETKAEDEKVLNQCRDTSVPAIVEKSLSSINCCATIPTKGVFGTRTSSILIVHETGKAYFVEHDRQTPQSSWESNQFTFQIE